MDMLYAILYLFNCVITDHDRYDIVVTKFQCKFLYKNSCILTYLYLNIVEWNTLSFQGW